MNESVKSRDLMEEENIGKMVKTIRHSFMFRYVLSRTRPYNGTNIPLQKLIQDIRNDEVYLNASVLPEYITAIFYKLQGLACNHACGRTFSTTDDLIIHLRDRFEPELEIQHRIILDKEPENCSDLAAKTVTIRDLY